jgi:adenylate cyclase
MPSTLSKAQRRTHRTLRIALAWVIAGLLVALWESNALERAGLAPSRAEILDHYFWLSLLCGLLGGGTYIFLLRDRLRNLPFLPAFGIMSLGILVVMVVVRMLAHMTGFTGLNGTGVNTGLVTWQFLGNFLGAAILMGATMLMVRLNDQLGAGTAGFLMGGYFKPRQELRIFMFLDMRSSTAIAERIGDTRYFQLLNDVYTDITDPVIYTEGDIYQYVGDEISVSWKLQRGIKGQRCLRCFFAIREKLQRRAAYYREQYGIVPVFKAGFHYGQVTTGEIGLVKKQTIFSGDVVNTAAHIQAACNEHGVEILVSKDLLDVLLLPPSRWNLRSVGEVPLKGKLRSITLYTVSPVQETTLPAVEPQADGPEA